MINPGALEQGRESFQRQAWLVAYNQLSAADRETPLQPEDLERLAIAAHLLGKDDQCAEAWLRAHRECLRLGNTARAVRCAFWLAFGLLNLGEFARGAGWLTRAQRMLEAQQQDCAEQGFLLLPLALQRIEEGDPATAYTIFCEINTIADRFRDPDLMTLGRLGRGQALIRLGQTTEGLALLDEVMVAVTAGEVSPIVVGTAYCAVIEACHDIFDLRRAQEWTSALSQWCASHPDLVPYRGQCLIHRAEILQLHGAWPDAMDEAQRAGELLSRPPGQPAVGAAFYQKAELHRLRGEFAQAEDAYRQASRWGREPQPGLALLRLVQGQVDAAVAAIHRAVDEARDRVVRSRLLAAYIDIMAAAGNVGTARAAADELSETAAAIGAPLLLAVSAYANGVVGLVEGDARVALPALRRACAIWQELEAPYETARVRVLIGLACRELGDEDTAQMELDAACWSFQQLGAVPDVARVQALSRQAAPRPAHGLTAREVQVLRLVSAGKTNRAIAADLFISEKTVARHVSNIFSKLGLSSRAAATAYAYEHDLA